MQDIVDMKGIQIMKCHYCKKEFEYHGTETERFEFLNEKFKHSSTDTCEVACPECEKKFESFDPFGVVPKRTDIRLTTRAADAAGKNVR